MFPIKLQQILRDVIISVLIYFPILQSQAQPVKGLPHPKNIIILIGDGMGFNHIKVTNYYLGMAEQVYEKFPVCLAMSHYQAKAGEYIDWASHSNQKGRLIEEMKGFDEAINTVVDWVNTHSNWNETMVMVTGDHETGFLWGEEPFVPIRDQGRDHLPVMKFNSAEHTNSLIPFFAKGSGSEFYRNFADERASVRGPYIQNSEIPQLIHFLWTK